MFPSVAVLQVSNAIRTSGVIFHRMLAVAREINSAPAAGDLKPAPENIVQYVAAMAKRSAMGVKPLQLDMMLLMLVFADRVRRNSCIEAGGDGSCSLWRGRSIRHLPPAT